MGRAQKMFVAVGLVSGTTLLLFATAFLFSEGRDWTAQLFWVVLHHVIKDLGLQQVPSRQ